MCELCAGIEKTHVALKKQEDSQWCGENIEIWKENNQAYLGYEGSAFPISFCPKCGQRLTPEEPLTVEELKEMNGEPVWIKVINHVVFSDKEDDFDGWGLCRKSWVRCWDGRRADLVHIDYDFEDYGKEWLAYRHKPIKEEK